MILQRSLLPAGPLAVCVRNFCSVAGCGSTLGSNSLLPMKDWQIRAILMWRRRNS